MLLFENYIKGGAADVYQLRLHRQGGQLVLGHCLVHVSPQNKKHPIYIIANSLKVCNVKRISTPTNKKKLAVIR